MKLIKYSINSKIIKKGDPSVKGWINKESSIDTFINLVTKKGYAFSPVLIDNHNSKKPSKSDIHGWQVIALDIDNAIGKSMKSSEQGYFSFQNAYEDEFIKENAYFLYTTPSHKDEHHKFRIVFILEELLTNIETYSNVITYLVNQFGADKACKSAERMFFGNLDAEVNILGNFLEINTIMDISNQVNEIKTIENETNTNSISENVVKEMLGYIPKQLDYMDWFAIISAVGNTFDENIACKLVDEWSPSSNPDTRTKLKKRGKDFSIATVIYYSRKNGWKGIIPANLESQLFLTQVKIAVDFAESFNGKLKYDNTSSKWLLWNGKKWHYDNLQQIKNTLIEFISKTYGKKGKSFQTNHTVNSILSLLQTKEYISSENSDFDSHNDYLNLKNGVYDLSNNMLINHSPELFLSKYIDIDYSSDAVCPEYIKFISKIFNNNYELISFIQRLLGLTLHGDMLENILLFCYGFGKNGKSVFFNIIQIIFGDYFCKIPTDMILTKNYDSIPNDLAMLPGKRIAVPGEIPENRFLNEGKVKDLTGGDSITARFLRGEYFSFPVTSTFWLYGNHKPRIKGNDDGIWRRIYLLPFIVEIKEEDRIPMVELMKRFELEKEGILNWIIQGWQSYQQIGLNPPNIVTDATKEYREEQDSIHNYINECCIIEKSFEMIGATLYSHYKEWCKNYDYISKTNQEFYNYLNRIDGIQTIERRKNKYIQGITFKNAEY